MAHRQTRKSARKEGRQSAKMSYVAQGKKNPGKRAKHMTRKNESRKR